jgi:hypothetical protein
MRFAMLKSLLCLTMVTSFVHAQQPEAATTPVEKTPAAQEKESQATVYIYRYKQFVGSALSPSVYCDENELARMDNGKFFVVKLAPGKHVFRSNDKQAGIESDLKAGQDYYIRVELATGFMKGHGRLMSVAPDQGSYEIKNLKPLGAEKVKDGAHVIRVNLEAK